MSKRAVSGFGAISLSLVAALFLDTAGAQTQSRESPPPGSAAARAAMFAERGAKQPSYTKKFDLSGLPHYSPEEQVSGKLRVWGNNYIGDSNLASYWEEGFRKHQPGMKLEFNLPTAAIAIPALTLGLADLAMDQEPTFYDYLGHLRILGFEPTGVSAVTGAYNVGGWLSALAVAVPKGSPLTKLTLQQLDGIFGSERAGGWIGSAQWHPEFGRGPEQNIRRWGQLGATGEWADKRINLYGPSLRYQAALLFSGRVLHGSDKWNEALRGYGNLRRPDGTVYGWMAQMADEMKKDPYSIGLFHFTEAFSPDLRVLALAKSEKDPYVELTIDTVQNRTYPLWLEQSFYVSVKPGSRMDPKVKEFLRYVLSQEGQDAVQRDGKYLPLTAEVVREQLQKLN